MPGPPVVLVHGFASSFEHDWQRNGWVDILADEGKAVLALDLPGHGLTPREPELVTPGDTVLATVGDGPADGVGFSAGGHALLSAAVARPDAFRRIAVLGVGAIPGEAPDPERGQVVAAAFESDEQPNDAISRLLRRLSDSAGNDRQMLVRALRAPSRRPTRDQLAALPMPVLLVVGERDFNGTGEELAELIPGAQLVVLPRTDHFATLTDFRCIEAVVRFLTA